MTKIISSAILMLSIVYGMTFAQEQAQEKLKTSISLNYYKNSDNAKALTAKVTSKKEKRPFPVANATVHFFVKSMDNHLGDIQTNDEGEATVEIPEEKLLRDSLGNIILIAKFDGDDAYKSAEGEITVKDVRMELSLSVIDSVKTISVTANEPGNGKEIPLEGVDISFYAQRLFGNLNIGTGLLENGQSSIAFQYNDLPGDSVGNVTISVKIENNETYGNVEKKATIDWGVPTIYDMKKSDINTIIIRQAGSNAALDRMFLSLITVIVILILITIVYYKRS
ncbi:MAG: hypothetical protein HYY40_10915 [Bacteroidetes bacterium]|nr:hypothetical protein [Bacteroidota bacterium]